MRSGVGALVAALMSLVALDATAAEWVDSAKHGRLTYFLFASPPEVARFDAGTGQWLARIPVPASPTAIAADAGAIYVSSGASVWRTPLAGGAAVPLASLAWPVVDLASEGECDFGQAIPKGTGNNKWVLLWPQGSIVVLGEVLSEVIESIVSSETGEPVDIELDGELARVKSTAKVITGRDIGRGKKLKLTYTMKAVGPWSPPRP